MKEIKINELAYIIKQAKAHGQPKPIFFLGAGASKTGNIPLAKEIVKDILKKYPDNPFILKLEEKEKTYPKLMECLSPHERNELLKKYIDEAKINVTHIYLAQLLKNDFADYVLTVNFDNLMLRALALYNIFPPTYDMAILNDLTTTTFPEKSVVYLHGQHHGLWLLNTEKEMEKVHDTIPRIFDSIKNKRPWIFIGYSGSDPIFEHVCKLGRFDNGLYWVGFNNDVPHKDVQEFLTTSNKNASIIRGYDADAFMLKLNQELGLEQPQILDKPFSSLEDMLHEINDIDDEDHFKPVKERLEIAKKNVFKAIEQFEKGKIGTTTSERELQIDTLKEEIIRLSISQNYDEAQIATVEEQVKKLDDKSLNELLGDLYLNWGYEIGRSIDIKGKEKDYILKLKIKKYQKAIEHNFKLYIAYYNWGYNLGELAKLKKGKEKEKLFEQSKEKYLKVIEINSNYIDALNNLGNNLCHLAKLKTGKEKEKLLLLSFEKYQKANEIDNKEYTVLDNWGASLIDLAKLKKGREKEILFKQAIEKFQKSIDLGGKQYNMACLHALLKNRKEALDYLDSSLKRSDESVDVVLQDKDWQHYLEDEDFKSIIEKYS
ncbi:MAG: SIR2 family protein [Bacteroidota bacterium]